MTLLDLCCGMCCETFSIRYFRELVLPVPTFSLLFAVLEISRTIAAQVDEMASFIVLCTQKFEEESEGPWIWLICPQNAL